MKKKSLENLARNLGLRGWTSMRKNQLEAFVADNIFGPEVQIDAPVLAPAKATELIEPVSETQPSWEEIEPWLTIEPLPPKTANQVWLGGMIDATRNTAHARFFTRKWLSRKMRTSSQMSCLVISSGGFDHR